MFCENCGAALAEGVHFCPECGAPVTASGVQMQQMMEPQRQTGGETVVLPASDNGFSKALTLFIFADVGAVLGWIPYTCLIGLVFSAIARGMARRFVDAGYQIGGQNLTGKAKVSGIFAQIGRIVSLVGLIVSIVVCVFMLLFIALVIFGAVAKNSGLH